MGISLLSSISSSVSDHVDMSSWICVGMALNKRLITWDVLGLGSEDDSNSFWQADVCGANEMAVE